MEGLKRSNTCYDLRNTSIAKEMKLRAKKIHASPTKEFFVRMITKDISLIDCILDLIDNCLDGARKVMSAAGQLPEKFDYSGFNVNIQFQKNSFAITDNCGGIAIAEAIDYAFHFGRRPNAPSDGDYSIGLYGIGMKRAIFKLGKHIVITSSTSKEAFSTTIDVNEWLGRAPLPDGGDDWDFDMVEQEASEPGTSIIVSALNPDVALQFENPSFANALARIISRDYSLYLAKGFQVSVNGRKMMPFAFTVKESQHFKPLRLRYVDETGVEVEIIAGMSGNPPDDLQPIDQRPEAEYYGWFVVCNERVVVAADKSEQTVWGVAGFPSWHFQYNGFIGVVSFESKDPKLLPWKTTKRDVDVTNGAYRRAVEKMKDVTRAWINYTNERKSDMEAAKKEEAKAVAKPLFETSLSARLEVPKVNKVIRISTSSIQYTKPNTEIAKVKLLLGNSAMSNARAGEMTFDYFLANESSE